jgi:hypothetical protein
MNPLIEYENVIAMRIGAGAYVAPGGAIDFRTLRAYRNGLRMAPGIDYTVSGGVITPIYPWSAEDIVLLDYTT